VFFRVMFVRAMRFGVVFFRTPVPACLCEPLQILRLGLTGVGRGLVQRNNSARRQYCAQRQYGICSAHDLLALGERDPPQSAQRLRR